ncbi:hypothetical protein Fmac_014902 [Flemingia macrophylla]|uniref:Uncharacterized protein n=1 Tax=Flemingia macrophylla TaxID=520843 RepID=A0ABD1MD38_9FABA
MHQNMDVIERVYNVLVQEADEDNQGNPKVSDNNKKKQKGTWQISSGAKAKQWEAKPSCVL